MQLGGTGVESSLIRLKLILVNPGANCGQKKMRTQRVVEPHDIKQFKLTPQIRRVWAGFVVNGQQSFQHWAHACPNVARKGLNHICKLFGLVCETFRVLSSLFKSSMCHMTVLQPGYEHRYQISKGLCWIFLQCQGSKREWKNSTTQILVVCHGTKFTIATAIQCVGSNRSQQHVLATFVFQQRCQRTVSHTPLLAVDHVLPVQISVTHACCISRYTFDII